MPVPIFRKPLSHLFRADRLVAFVNLHHHSELREAIGSHPNRLSPPLGPNLLPLKSHRENQATIHPLSYLQSGTQDTFRPEEVERAFQSTLFLRRFVPELLPIDGKSPALLLERSRRKSDSRQLFAGPVGNTSNLERLEGIGGRGYWIISCFQLSFASIRPILRKIRFSIRLRGRYRISDDHLIWVVAWRKIPAPIKCGFDRRAIQSFFR